MTGDAVGGRDTPGRRGKTAGFNSKDTRKPLRGTKQRGDMK